MNSVALKKAKGSGRCKEVLEFGHLFGRLRRGVFSDSLGSLRHSMFGQFSWQQKSNGGLDIPRCDDSDLSNMR